MSEQIKNLDTYDENDIQVLEGLEAVRKRPGMYIGSTSLRGLHHLVYEIVDNSIDEALQGYCKNIKIAINEDGSITNEDDGRGIPCGIHPKKKISTLQVILATLHSGGKFGGNGYKISGGLHGVGSSVVNALSSHFIATIHRDGNIYQQEYSEGKPLYNTKIIGKSNKTGTTITFTPDNKIFENIEFNYETLSKRLKEKAFLNKGIKIIFEDKRKNNQQINEYHYEGGIKEFIEYLNEDKTVLHNDILYVEKDFDGDYNIEIALQYTDSFNSLIYTYVNNINTIEGGTHLTGFKSALLKSFDKYREENKISKEKFTHGDILEGLTAIVSIKMSEAPEFEGQTKTKLGTSKIRTLTYQSLDEYLEIYFKENPKLIEMLVNRAKKNQEFRLNSKKNKELSKRKKSLENNNLCGKLADCASKDINENEVHIVEGDSAGGSAKKGRNRKFQAILPSKGKIMNIEKQTLEKVLESVEIRNGVSAIGTGMGEDFDITKLKFGKICLMQDCDSDGKHIRSLWITFFYRYMRQLIEDGHIFLDAPPLYRNTIKNKFYYTYSETEQDKFLSKYSNEKITGIQRYKGLGEMDAEQLWETTLNPETRILYRVTIEDAIEAEKTLVLLMGNNVEPRKQFLIKRNNRRSNI